MYDLYRVSLQYICYPYTQLRNIYDLSLYQFTSLQEHMLQPNMHVVVG